MFGLVLIVLGAFIVVLFFLVVAGRVLVNIGGDEVGLIERRYFGRDLPEGRVIAMRGEIGIQARVLPPGLYFLGPFLYRVTKDRMILVAENQVGLLEAIVGLPLDSGRIFARRVTGHDSYQDGEGFLRNGGQKGPQIDILPPGKYRV